MICFILARNSYRFDMFGFLLILVSSVCSIFQEPTPAEEHGPQSTPDFKPCTTEVSPDVSSKEATKDPFNWSRRNIVFNMIENLDLTSFKRALEDVQTAPPNIDRQWIVEQSKTWPECGRFLTNKMVAKAWLAPAGLLTFKNPKILTVARTHSSGVRR